jgi:hypothetical protein
MMLPGLDGRLHEYTEEELERCPHYQFLKAMCRRFPGMDVDELWGRIQAAQALEPEARQ